MSLLKKLRQSLVKSSQNTNKLDVKEKQSIEAVEEALICADIDLELIDKIIAELERKYKKMQTQEELVSFLHQVLLNNLPFEQKTEEFEQELLTTKHNQPKVLLFVGNNGVGKTTSIAKLSKRYSNLGAKVLIIAADTFRAAAIEQLQNLTTKFNSKNQNVVFFSLKPNTDPGAVVHSGLEMAQAKKFNVIFVDTAGRLASRNSLIAELEKIHRITKKYQFATETVMVLDANHGKATINEVESFNKSIKINNLIITKLDGTAKGGIIFALHKLKIPIRYLGVGEMASDIYPFSATEYVTTLLKIS